MDRIFMFIYVYEKFCTQWVFCPCSGAIYIHVHDHNIQTSSLKPLGQSKSKFMWIVFGTRKESLYKWSRSHDQDGRLDYE